MPTRIARPAQEGRILFHDIDPSMYDELETKSCLPAGNLLQDFSQASCNPEALGRFPLTASRVSVVLLGRCRPTERHTSPGIGRREAPVLGLLRARNGRLGLGIRNSGRERRVFSPPALRADHPTGQRMCDSPEAAIRREIEAETNQDAQHAALPVGPMPTHRSRGGEYFAPAAWHGITARARADHLDVIAWAQERGLWLLRLGELV